METTTKSKSKVIVMLGIHLNSRERGGISSVIDVYKRGGLFDEWPILYIGTVASGSHFHKIGVGAAALWNFLCVLVTGRIALVHAHTASRASFWRKSIFILIALAARRPVVLHLHGAEFDRFFDDECGSIRKWFIRYVLNHVNRVVVLSSQWKAFIERIASGATVVKLFNPICVTVESFDRERRSDNILLFLGRFGRRKGIFDLLQALAIVRRQFPAVELHCGGDGDAAAVEARARELGIIASVRVLGWVSGAAKERELSEAAIYVLPSYAEGLPMGVLEAMSAGAPVVATSVGGIPDAVTDGVEGYLIEPGDIDALADRIMRLLGNIELRRKFTSAARRKVVELFSPEKVLSQMGEIYRSLGATPLDGQEDRGAFF